ncbi:Chs5p-Arf1p-binding proteins-domain-containing protein [Pavlovales sp. CCMP2436]|nr:Chs5p-Arf1p-binding proteins-domain-containing protein [Pavlovales sp. CCMP2436]
MSERLLDVLECVEAVAGEALAARTEAQAHFTGVGPPDLCYVLKGYEPTLGLGLRSTLKGYWHSVVGLDASSAAAISAYLSELSQRQEPGAWLSAGEWRIVGGTYCAWDAFAQRDVRVEVKIPGGVTAYSVDCHGARAPTTEEQWRQLGVCAILRALCSPPADEALQLLPSPLTIEREAEFLEDVLAIAQLGVDIGGAFTDAALASMSPAEPPAAGAAVAGGGGEVGVLCSLMWAYFAQSHRFRQAADFFAQVVPLHPACAALLARARRACGESTLALDELCYALDKHPDNVPLLRAQADLSLELRLYAEGLALSSAAVQLAPRDVQVWLVLARAYLLNGAPELALLALNAAPVHVRTRSREAALELFPCAGMATPERLTNGDAYVGPQFSQKPNSNMVAVEADAVIRSAGEASVALTGVAALLPDEFVLPAELLGNNETQAYAVLVEAVSEVGWEALLACRDKVFAAQGEGSAEGGREGSSGSAAIAGANVLPGGDARAEHAAAALSPAEDEVSLRASEGEAEGEQAPFCCCSSYYSCFIIRINIY